MTNERNGPSPHEHTPKNAGAWDGPFTAGNCQVHDDTPGVYDGHAVFDAAGEPFALVADDNCVGGHPGSRARATRIAECLNRDQHRFQRQLAAPVLQSRNGDVPVEQGFALPSVTDPAVLIDCTIGRLRLGASNEANHPADREWCASLAGDLQRALDTLEARLLDPLGEREVEADTQAAQLAGVTAGDYQLRGSVLALAQSLKVMGEQAKLERRDGWGVVAERAEGFVRAVALGVTRFLAQPDLRVRHASLDFDLQVAGCDVLDSGSVRVRCAMHGGAGTWVFPLNELVAAGPVNDAVRAAVTGMMQVMVEETVGKVIEAGGLRGLAHFRKHGAAFAAGEDVVAEPGGETVHNLQVHDEYVLGEGGHAEPVLPPGYCPDCRFNPCQCAQVDP